MTLTTRYSDQETALLEKLHREGHNLEQIATELNRSVRSVRAKLSSLGLYQKAPYLSKSGELPKKKEEYVKEIADLLEVDEYLVDSLEKCTKFTLKKILEKLQSHQSQEPGETLGSDKSHEQDQ
jgi:hypothetical protein